jgi:aquaporin Z
VRATDAAFYSVAQFVGGAAGVLLMATLLGPRLAHPAVNYVATVPGPRGAFPAFLAEVAMTFLLMTVVLVVSSRPRWARWTGVCAGILVASYIAFEAPISGMSLNPARSFASSVVAWDWRASWIYFAAPVLGMQLAALVHVRRRATLACAKLHHQNTQRCIFCATRP